MSARLLPSIFPLPPVVLLYLTIPADVRFASYRLVLHSFSLCAHTHTRHCVFPLFFAALFALPKLPPNVVFLLCATACAMAAAAVAVATK